MVERNTVNILINVRFILKACINYREQLYLGNILLDLYSVIILNFNYLSSYFICLVIFQTILKIIIVDNSYYTIKKFICR